jgi:hypothetical protein
MTRCSDSSKSPEAGGGDAVSLDLNLPESPDFVSLPPLVSFEEMSRRIRQLRVWFPAGIPTPAERWEARIRVEFTL